MERGRRTALGEHGKQRRGSPIRKVHWACPPARAYGTALLQTVGAGSSVVWPNPGGVGIVIWIQHAWAERGRRRRRRRRMRRKEDEEGGGVS